MFVGRSSVQLAQRCSLPSLCRPSRDAPLSTPVMAVRFFVVLLLVRDLLLGAKHLFVAARSTSIRASDQASLLQPTAGGGSTSPRTTATSKSSTLIAPLRF